MPPTTSFHAEIVGGWGFATDPTGELTALLRSIAG